MSEKLLTIGMATYDDYDGVYFTIQALRMHQLKGIEDKVEIIVIDNNPTSKHGKEVKTFVEGFAKGKYIPYIERQSTFVKYDIFKYASGKYTLCIDCHIMFEENAIKNLLEYYEKNPNTKNLIQGPLLNDDLKNISTHFDPVWRDRMYGIWACNRIEYQKNEPFEIPMMGMGVFSCKTDSFPNINNNFKGFGGEEGYIAEKFRQNGGNNICLPSLKWIHRFKRPNGVPYKNLIEDRIWNYFLGWYEIYRDENHPFIISIYDYFHSQHPNIDLKKIKEEVKLLF
jgi:hypothetical protein